MNRAVARLRSLPLRSRLALLVTTAVAVAVAASAVACWFLVRDVLYESLDDTLRQNRVDGDLVAEMARQGECKASGPVVSYPNPGSRVLKLTIQVVNPEGERCVIGGEPLKVTPSDIAVATGRSSDTSHDAKTSDGTDYRVLTYPLEHYKGAVTVGRPLAEVHSTLSNLTLLLALVAGVGVVGAGAAGLWVARTGLRPVDELTGTVEHVARTEDLTVRIPADGDDEIARLSRSFNAMTAALASSQERQAQLIADAGHELRTPLTSLRTNIELLARSEETGRAIPAEDRKALLASVKAQMTELAALIGDLQELSRPDESGRSGKVEVVALHTVVRTAIDRARLRGPELSIEGELAPWYVRAEAPALERAVVNVLDNAVKFSPPGGRIDVRLDRGELTVRDRGPGIPEDELPHVFDRFWRSPSARSLPGSGLGLSIVARTVQQCGGEVSLRRAEDGMGTVAVIRLPGAPTPPPDTPTTAR
ncbi:HAMP domain-containing sensor histidine kinase [Streptomyces sp. LHD-70]|uniref:HAMP domain-containing sensor histidine kinase n=1 Tax=Streptomyces sp. LHD-70 TaxID=3072140 RepID=UPI00280E5FE2|nr:HAMP domain-containing sensor histidine kinase [Streptomyces sp. LHD-70]MDQ8704829.1 HAMP domain-containing sensor histidine kinase [Streptomyces sp. LHD-70]